MNANTHRKYKITITPTDMLITGNCDFLDLMHGTLNAILNSAMDICSQNPDSRSVIFDQLNAAFSNVLHTIDPTVDLHPEIDIDAVLAEQNEAMDKAIAEKDKDSLNKIIEG